MQTIYRTPVLYVIGMLLLASVLVWFGYREARRNKDKKKLSGPALIAWVLALIAVGVQIPSYFLDEIHFDESHMRWAAGPWWDRDDGSISLSDVKAVRVSVEGGSGRSGFKRTVWHLDMKSGTVEHVTVSDLWMKHYQSVKAHFVSRGIAIEDQN